MSTQSSSKAAVLAQVQALIAGTEKHFPNGTFTIGNTTYTAAALIQALQSLAQALTALNAAQSGANDAMTAFRGTRARVAPLVRGYKDHLLTTFGTATQPLADFGLQPARARKPLDSQQRATAVAKLRATRAARGTTSRKQKLAVKGNVTSVVVTPVTSAPSSSLPTAPVAASAAPVAASPAAPIPTASASK